ncbi:hypothetical protein CL689_05585 [Candidatus Saccharibacteria bacterium]|nr:hypothetical protein [Candidatus Saccharibacteria bacterium]MBJ58318.1 hypothetical protein [Candidatus Saccharibacteria bacterium]MBQ69515.1 hypothetical protein [Candidatus Saccharibacteria bacterium]|tara:strand:- start:13347 stop:13763 length:417 start_codon:yes stop_codon:yes gene_type:complete
MVKAVLFDCFGVVLDVVTNERMEATIDFIRELKGEYKLGMISNVSSGEVLRSLFRKGELDQLFDVVVASGDVGVAKPQAQIYWKALNALDVLPEEALFIDDIARFTDAASDLGLQTLLFESEAVSLPAIRQQLKEVSA